MHMGGFRFHVVIVGGGFAGRSRRRARWRQRWCAPSPCRRQPSPLPDRCSPGRRRRPVGAGRRRASSPRPAPSSAAATVLMETWSRSSRDRRECCSATVARSITTSAARHRRDPCVFQPGDWAACAASGLKTLDDALHIRRRILSRSNAPVVRSDAACATHLRHRRRRTTGVELAGTLAEIARHARSANSAASIRAKRACCCC